MEKPKTYTDIRRENFHEHGRAAIAIADLALAQIDETLSDCGLLLSSYTHQRQPEISLILYSN
jgi:hypothetical protein